MSSAVPVSKYKHIFVSGPPRAGTTLIELVLSAHSMITITPETLFIQQLFKRFQPGKKLDKDEIGSVIQIMKVDRKLNSWPKFNLDTFIKRYPLEPGMSVGEILDCVFRFYAEQISSGTEYLGNKKGLYASGYGPYAKKLFPDAKFLYIVRDPRDITRSVLDNLSKSSLAEAAGKCWIRDRHIRKMVKLFPNDTLVLRYEDLVLEPERTCLLICNFLAVPFDEGMLTFYKLNPNSERLIGVTKNIHPHTTTPFNPGLIEQWKRKRYFTSEELQNIEALTGSYMKRYGYKAETSSNKTSIAVTRVKMLLRLGYRELRRKIAK